MAYVCKVCGYVYEGDDFEDLPDDWVCPLCGCLLYTSPSPRD